MSDQPEAITHRCQYHQQGVQCSAEAHFALVASTSDGDTLYVCPQHLNFLVRNGNTVWRLITVSWNGVHADIVGILPKEQAKALGISEADFDALNRKMEELTGYPIVGVHGSLQRSQDAVQREHERRTKPRRFNCREQPYPQTPRSRTIDLCTGEQLPYLLSADEATGEYEQYVHDGQRFVIDPATKRIQTRKGKTELRIDWLTDDEPYLLADVPQQR